MDKQVCDSSRIDIERIVEIVRTELCLGQIGNYYEKILFAAVLFELGAECAIKFGNAKILNPYRMWARLFTEDFDHIHSWVELNGDIIDLALGLRIQISKYGFGERICFDYTKISEENIISINLERSYFSYKPFSIKNGKKRVGELFCNSNKTLYKDLNMNSEFILRAKISADKYRLAVNSK